jgi:hypothetical protein
MRTNRLLVFLAAFGAVVLSSSAALAKDNWLGTWKLDPAKSTFSPAPGPGIQTLKFESTHDGIKLISEGVNAEGKATKGEYVAKFDGTDVSWKGNPDADTASPKRIDDNNYENTWKKAGKVTMTAKVSVSADGKTLTVIQTGTNSKGEAVSNKAVYNKQ